MRNHAFRRRFLVGMGFLALLVGFGPPAEQAAPFPDDLVDWRPDPSGPVFAGTNGDTWDRRIRERGWVLVESGRMHLFYTGYNDDRSPSKFLGHATSTDGVCWERDPRNPIHAEGWVEDVCVVRRGSTYYMFAEGKDDIAHRLISTDLTHWTEEGPIDIRRVDGRPISAGPRGTPVVLIEDGVWNLFYERGDQGVWLARSRDGRTFTNVSDEPVLGLGPEKYDKAAVAMNQVFKRDGVYYAYYHANSERPWKEWTTCLARSRDLVHWEKAPNNPILDANRSSGVLVESESGAHFYTMHPQVQRYSNPPRP